jgi:hypothetical protein
MRLKLLIGPAGAVALPAGEVAAAGLAPESGVEWSALPGMGIALGAGAGAWIAGTLGAASFAEVAQLLASGLRSGVLHLSLPGSPIPVRKSISFREGQVIFASSTDPADRLGAVLVRAGKVDAEAVERCAPLLRPGRPLGQLLVEQGLLTAGQLYDGIAAQVREIFLSGFETTAGEFLFREGPPDERNAVRLPERTRELLLAGMRRAEALELKAASAPPAPAEPARASGPFEAYRRLLRAVHGSLVRAAPGARARLDSWFRRLPPPQAGFFEGVRFDSGGELDVQRVLANVERVGSWTGAAARAKALETLEGLLTFALFEAKNLLPREEAEALRREVHRIQMGG